MKNNVFNIRFAVFAGIVIVAAAIATVIFTGKDAASFADIAPAAGEAAVADSAQAPAWQQRCEELADGGRYCEAVQNLTLVRTGEDAEGNETRSSQRLIEIAIGYPPAADGKARGVAILPLGILVDEEVEILVDDKKVMDFDVRYCDAGGCIAMLEPSESELNKMRKGSALTVMAETAKGQPLEIKMSLRGFTAAMDAVKPAG